MTVGDIKKFLNEIRDETPIQLVNLGGMSLRFKYHTDVCMVSIELYSEMGVLTINNTVTK